jgi:hypothetical protein
MHDADDAVWNRLRVRVLPRLEPMRLAADPEVHQVVAGKCAEAMPRITLTDPTCVLVAIAGGGHDHPHAIASGEIDRMTSVHHDKSIRDAVKMRHQSERRADVQEHRRDALTLTAQFFRLQLKFHAAIFDGR